MSELSVNFGSVPAFAKALKQAAPEYIKIETGKAFYKIGKSDTERMRSQGLGGLNVKAKYFRNSFKYFATDSRQVKSVDQIRLSEYTGAKPFKIFQDGGDIVPFRAKMLTILTAAARNPGGKRKYTQKELKAMIQAGVAAIIKTKEGAAIILVNKQRKKNQPAVVLAWLRPQVHETKRIDFWANFEANNAAHEVILDAAAQAAIDRTIADDEYEELYD
jgi:hypothetical protein